MQRKLCVAVILSLFLTGCASLITPNLSAEPEALRAGQYRLDKDHATLLFKINHMGLSTYVGRFNSFDASLDFDADNPQAARVSAVIDVNSLDVNNPPFAETLIGPGWFDASGFPQAKFESTTITLTGDTTGQMTGTLTLKGVTHPITFDVGFVGGAENMLSGKYTVGFSATGTFKRSDFGVSKFLGVVGDDVTLEIHAEFQRD